MTTSDGISSDDWDRVHELALDVVNAEEEEEEDLCRRRLLEYLDELEEKYGPLPSILSTRADYLLGDVPGRIALFKRAYATATEAGDARNQLYVASSLAALYVFELEDIAEGSSWLAHAEKFLDRVGTDVDRREFGRVKEHLQRLQSRG
jgi:hypothetical protein